MIPLLDGLAGGGFCPFHQLGLNSERSATHLEDQP